MRHKGERVRVRTGAGSEGEERRGREARKEGSRGRRAGTGVGVAEGRTERVGVEREGK